MLDFGLHVHFNNFEPDPNEQITMFRWPAIFRKDTTYSNIPSL